MNGVAYGYLNFKFAGTKESSDNRGSPVNTIDPFVFILTQFYKKNVNVTIRIDQTKNFSVTIFQCIQK